MFKNFVFIFCIFFCESSLAQLQFQERISIPDSFARITSVSQALDESYVFAGSIGVPLGLSIPYLFGLNSTGDTSWTQTLTGYEGGWTSVKSCSDMGYIQCGSAWINNSFDGIIGKTDSSGNLKWLKRYGGNQMDFFYSILTTNDGFVVLGNTTNSSNGNYSLYLLRIDSTGNIVWTKTYDIANNHEGLSLIRTSDGGVVFTGTVYNQWGADIYLLKTDSIGNPIWCRVYGTGEEEKARSMIESEGGGYIITGHLGTAGNHYDALVLKTDSIGNILWSNTYHLRERNFSSCIANVNESEFVFGGYTDSLTSVYNDGFLIKADTAGNVIWTKLYGDTNEEAIFSIQRCKDNGFVLGGDYYLTNYDYRGYIIKTNSFGESGCNELDFNPVRNSYPLIQASVIPTSSTGGNVFTVPFGISHNGIIDSVCNNIGIPEYDNVNEIVLYPNPATDIITLSFEGEPATGKISILNSNFEKVFLDKLENNFTYELDVRKFSPGFYYVVLTNDYKIYFQKFIKGF